MRAADVKCNTCGGMPQCNGSDWSNEEGPWHIACSKCGKETDIWGDYRKAWKQWKNWNRRLSKTEEDTDVK